MVDGKEMFQQLWDFTIRTIETIGVIWEWLMTKHYIGLKIDIIGVNFGFELIPMAVAGALMLTLIAFAFIKQYIPLA